MLRKKIKITIITIAMVLSTTVTVFAGSTDGWTEASKTSAAANGAWEAWIQKWETVKKDPVEIALTPGRDATELNFAWYSKDTEPAPKFKIGKNQDMSDAKELKVTTVDAVTGYKSNKTKATNLEENATYYYSYQVNGVYTNPVEYTTKQIKNFSILFVGDPQIGSSSSNIASGTTTPQGQDAAVRNDSFNWNNTINTAVSSHPNISFILSAGDQIQTSSPKSNEQDIEYAGFLSPDKLRSLPIAPQIGNHDSQSPNYSYHFNNPNASTLGQTTAGGDYYYTYGNSLFITLNTNNTNVAEHKQLIEDAISKNPNAKWRIVTIHQDIYGSGEHSNEPAIVNLRYNLVPILEQNKIDAVLTGHDHVYSRSFILKGGTEDNSKMMSKSDFNTQFDNDIAGATTTQAYKDYISSVEDSSAVQQTTEDVTHKNGNVVNPDGILYMTANSASGSKYYDMVNHKQAYIASRWQEDIPTYSTIDIDDTSFTINTYKTDTNEKIDNTFTIIKTAVVATSTGTSTVSETSTTTENSTITPIGTSTTTSTTTPSKTADNNNLVPVLMLAIVSLGSVAYLNIKKKTII